jgi:hypothetical protein
MMVLHFLLVAGATPEPKSRPSLIGPQHRVWFLGSSSR